MHIFFNIKYIYIYKTQYNTIMYYKIYKFFNIKYMLFIEHNILLYYKFIKNNICF